MNKLVFLSMCILVLLIVPAIVMAAPMGEENATMGNESNVTMMPDNMTGNQTENNTLVDVINQNQNLTILATAINATNLTETLSTGGPYTCFAPNDEAFGALGNDTIDQLLNNTTVLRQILLYHTVQGNYTSEQLLNMTQNQTMNQTTDQTTNMTQNQTENMTPQQNVTQTMTQAQNATELQTLLGQNLTISLNQSTGMLMVNNASVVQPDINASNGIIHIIDTVLIPENMTLSAMTTANQTVDNMTAENQSSYNGPTLSMDGGVMTWINRVS
ncbi:fasciclin domain-containing protein [Methanoculleus frigidifontis]|nr:fasciclin domain-containing protein [Methanoculleus sp. FWC-SCC1]